MIKYIGSKRRLVPAIAAVIRQMPDARSVVDFFSGTSRVGHALKRLGYRVLANDHLAYAHALATCYVAADREDAEGPARRWIAELDALEGKEGYFTETFCRLSRFFMPGNGARVDAIRARIAELAGRGEIGAEVEAVLLTSLMEAADRVDSTTGVQMAYLKSWAPRARNDLRLRAPELLPRSRWGKGEAHRLEAREAADRLEGDVAYVDPPYNQHSYLGNYHIWETLVRWDAPESYGVARKRVDCRTRKSDFNSRPKAANALADFLRRVRCPHLVVSFSNEGFIERPAIEEMLGERGAVTTVSLDHKRYVGARIGIHDPQGRRVGRVSHLRNREYLFAVSPPGADGGVEGVRRLARAWADRAQPELFAVDAEDGALG